MLPKELKPKHCYNLVRLGKNNDGGYLVEKDSLLNSESLISFGINLDWSFEKDFFKLKERPIHCYDHTIKYSFFKKFSRNSFLKFFNKKYYSISGLKEIFSNIKLYKDYKKFFSGKVVHFESAIGLGKNLVDMSTVFNRVNCNKIFLKIDIEGSEYRVLDDLIRYQDKITGLVIEFHNVDLHMSRILDFIRKLDLTIVHIHGQNPGGKDYLDQNQDPIQIEITFSRFNSFLDLQPQIPHELDQPADPRFDEIKLFFDQD
jgi:hypothetical protein